MWNQNLFFVKFFPCDNWFHEKSLNIYSKFRVFDSTCWVNQTINFTGKKFSWNRINFMKNDNLHTIFILNSSFIPSWFFLVWMYNNYLSCDFQLFELLYESQNTWINFWEKAGLIFCFRDPALPNFGGLLFSWLWKWNRTVGEFCHSTRIHYLLASNDCRSLYRKILMKCIVI